MSMKKCTLLLTVLLINISVLFAQNHSTAIKELMKEANIPGLTLAYVKDGKVQEHYSLGVTSAESGIVVNDSTVFSACSLGKTAFAYTIFKMIKSHQLDPDRPLCQYFNYKDVEGDPKYKLVTARMILTHSSGLPNWRDDNLYFKYNPGDRFSYSGEGFVWLSRVVEKITAKSIEDLVQETVFKPLKMNHTSYVWQSAFGENFAYPHTDIARTMRKDYPGEANVAMSLQTTAADYGKFLVAILSDKKFMAKLKSNKGIFVNKNVSWRDGLGYEETNQGSAFWQWGDNGTFKAFLIGYPEKKEGLVYFTNTYLGLRIARDLLGLFIHSDQPALDWLGIGSINAPDLQVFLRSLSMPVIEAISPYMKEGTKSVDTTLLDESKMNYLGNRFTQLGFYEKAKIFFELNLLNYPVSATSYRGLGELYMRNGEPKKSAEAWRQAYQLDQQYAYPKILADRLMGIPEPADTAKRIVHFRLDNYMSARFVVLSGSFNNWNDGMQPFNWMNGGWEADIQLKPGIYRYKFVIDGVWIPDPKNPELNKDSFDSILEVK